MHRMKKKHDLDYLIEPAYDHHSNPNVVVIRVDGCSESPALRRNHVNFSTIVLPDFV